RLKEEADAKRLKEEADAKRLKEEADAKRLKDGEGSGGQGKHKGNTNKGNDKSSDKGTGGGELTKQDLSGRISNASWKRPPTLDKLPGSENIPEGRSRSFTATITIDVQGNITDVKGVNTGDKDFDREVVRAIKRAKFHPFKNEQGQLLSGTAKLPLSF
ncbi:TonB family protein, partial [Moraxella oblonga]|uniref:TonB family protein n=1 Tax=Moraxella oblonga TaxID=200413 RepID=UPI000AC55004